MISRKHLLAIAAILLTFSVGLVGFYLFSAGRPDGLESVMEENGVEEGQPVWHAPLDYGDSYLGSLLMGMVGFALVFALFLGYLWLVKRRNTKAPK